MIRRVLDDPWRVFQIYALLLALVVALLGVVYLVDTAGEWSDDGRPVLHIDRWVSPCVEP